MKFIIKKAEKEWSTRNLNPIGLTGSNCHVKLPQKRQILLVRYAVWWVPPFLVLFFSELTNSSTELRLLWEGNQKKSPERTKERRAPSAPIAAKRRRRLYFLGKEAKTWTVDGHVQKLLLWVPPPILLFFRFLFTVRLSHPADAFCVIDLIRSFCFVVLIVYGFWGLQFHPPTASAADNVSEAAHGGGS